MIGIIASVVDGVLVGAVYGLAAMGLTLIWGVMNVINLTHGAIIVLGMFAVYFLTTAAGLSPYGGLPIVTVLGFLFGVVLYWISVNRVVGRPVLMSLLATFAMNMVLIGLGNPAGALIGGIALGLIEGLATPFMPVSWTPIIEFALFVATLIAFPRGIFAFSRS